MIRCRQRAAILLAGLVLAGCGQSASGTGVPSSRSSVPSATPATSASSPTSSPSAASHVILGLYSELPDLTAAQSIALREQQLGRSLAIHHTFYNWTDSFPSASQADDKAHGRIPLITWWGTHYAQINDGSQDVLIRQRAQDVRNFGLPVLLAWAPEMNLNTASWTGPQNGNDPAGYVRAFRRIHDIFVQEGVHNVSWVWAPNDESAPGLFDTSSPNNWRHYYPGDAYVDWVGIDGYNWGDVPGARWRSLASFIGPIYRDYAARKPIIISETASTAIGGSKPAWIDDARAWIKTHTAIRAFVWFDHRSSAKRDWRIDSSPESLSAFKALASDPTFAATG